MEKSILNKFKEKHYKLYRRVTMGTLIVVLTAEVGYTGLLVDAKIEGNKSFYTLTKGVFNIQSENKKNRSYLLFFFG